MTRDALENLEAEQSVLGAVLLDNGALERAREEGVRPEDFRREAHRLIFGAMIRLAERREAVDVVTLTEALETAGELERAGGMQYLMTLAETTPTAANVKSYARIVADLARRREAAKLAEEAERRFREPEASSLALLEWAERGFAEIRTRAPAGKRSAALGLDELLCAKVPPRRHVLEPILPEQGLAMLYAPRGTGKTYAALGMAVAVAGGGGFLPWRAPLARRVVYVDGELPLADLQARVASVVAGSGLDPADRRLFANLRFITPDAQRFGMPDLAEREGQALLERELRDGDFLVLDSISTLVKSGVENRAEDWQGVQDWIVGLRRRGVTVLMIHHAGKDGRQRGTSKREDVLDTVVAMRRPSDYREEEGARFEVRFEKSRGFHGAEARPFEARMEIRDGTASWTWRELEDVNLGRVAELRALGMSFRDIAEETGLSKSTVQRLTKRAGGGETHA